MAVLVKELKDSLLKTFENYEKLVVISGYASPDIINIFAKKGEEMGKPVTFYYGMYGAEGITERKLKSFIESQDKYEKNLSIFLVHSQRVHTKCYLFLNNRNEIKHALVGSANFSTRGLISEENAELLVELNDKELIHGSECLKQLKTYWKKICKISLKCTDPMVLSRPKAKIEPTIFTEDEKAIFPLTGSPYTAVMPLYTIRKGGKKEVPQKSGINWGLQKGHTKKTRNYAEAYIPVSAELIENYPLLFPPFPKIRKTPKKKSGGKVNRRAEPITVLWDDGEVMQMIFSGGGVRRPVDSERKPGDPFMEYPKQFTSADGGGEELGKYLRERMMKAGVEVGKEERITLEHFEKYGRDYITLTYVAPGEYEADFSNT